MSGLEKAIAAAREASSFYQSYNSDNRAHVSAEALFDLLAALDAARGEAVAWGMPLSNGDIIDCISPEEHAKYEGAYTVPLYAAPPAALAVPHVQDEPSEEGVVDWPEHEREKAWVQGWNACRRTMLAAAERKGETP